MSGKRKKRDLADETPAGRDENVHSSETGAQAGTATPVEESQPQPARVAAEAPGDLVAEQPAEEAVTGGPEGPTELTLLEARVRELEAEIAEVRDQLLRKAADFDNTRKRLARDKEESVRYANSALVLDLIEVIDGLERAIVSSESSQDFASLHQGVVLIERQLMDTLRRKWGLERISSSGRPFDPSLHQAVTMGEAAEGDDQVVLEEYQSGYLLNERVMRPAKVKVSAPRRSGASAASGAVDDPGPGSAGGGAAVDGSGAGA